MIAEHLTGAITSQEETLYEGIMRLPAAQRLIVRDGRALKRRYWDVDLSKEVRYSTDLEYAEHFREIFREAVRCRLRAHGVVGAELSGGLDSSSVVGMAQSLVSTGRAPSKALETFSVTFPGRIFDESPFINEVVQFWNLTSNILSWNWAEASLAQPPVSRYDLPAYPNQKYYSLLLHLAGRKGVRVLLTGFGGDEWLGGSPWYCADLLRRLRIVECLEELRHRGESGLTSSAFLNCAIVPLLPDWLLCGLGTVKRYVRRTPSPAWIPRQFAAKVGLRQRIRVKAPGQQQDFRTQAQRQLYSWLNGGGIAHQLEAAERYTARFSIEYRSPFHDRRIIEFALALPECQRRRHQTTKFILRAAMGSFLPELVRDRMEKASYDQVFAQEIEAQGGEQLFRAMAISSLGWAAEDELLKMFRTLAEAYRRNQEWLPHCWPLWNAFAIDHWYRGLFEWPKRRLPAVG
jgi:asparagine synthase (glutamine-hydrolysing)